MACARNGNGYDISSQNYFRELSGHLLDPIEPARRQSVAEARAKLRYEAFAHLLDCANLEKDGLPSMFKFQGHVTRAIDGTSFYTPRSDELLTHFSPRKTSADEGETHYPYGLCVSAINVYTGQPVRAVIDDYKASERSLLKRLIEGFCKGDLALLDRGLGGAQVYLEFHKRGQFFVHRAKTSGERVAGYIRDFLISGESQRKLKISIKDEETGEVVRLQIRLVLGPTDSEGKPIVFVTNLTSKKRYARDTIIELYRKRWSVETLYGRVKNLLCLEKFHARSHNGVMQEIFANFLILSLTAAAVAAVVDQDDVEIEVELPSFKNATEVVRRHLLDVVDHRIVGVKPKKLLKQILSEVRAIMYPIRPDRSYPRVSKQPIKSWNLKKSAKLKAFENQKEGLS